VTAIFTERMWPVSYIESFLFPASSRLPRCSNSRSIFVASYDIVPHLLDVCVSTFSVLGTVGGKTYGIAKNVNLIAVKVLNSQGSGSAAGAIAGINWVVTNADPDRRAVINMSIGGGLDIPLNEAVNNAVAAGVVVVVAAGNSNADACGFSPASAADAITVGATAKDDGRAFVPPYWASNYGSCLDIFAPGVGILSCSLDGGGRIASGTSMASPHVAGVAALLLEMNPTLTPAEVTQKMIDDATDGVVGNQRGSPNKLLYTGDITGPLQGPDTPDPPAEEPDCAADSASCSSNGDCCSGSCKGGGSNRFCK
jgi:subtilisin family serine protease